MPENWKKYQKRAAEFFTTLGLEAEVEKNIEGARSAHEVDVYVTGNYKGIDFTWVIECKSWSSNIPKEKVMALSAIVQDVGADRGFLLSEKGFQSGAIRSAARSNITLSSLHDLSESTEDYLIDAMLQGLFWRISKAQRRLRDIKREMYNDDFFPPTIEPLAKIGYLDSIIHDALSADDSEIDYPVNLDISLNRQGYIANDLLELLTISDRLVKEAEVWEPAEEKTR